MFETFIALSFAHILADFTLQTDRMVARKREIGMLALHIGIVILASHIALGHLALWPVLVLGGLHFAIDLLKSRFADTQFWAFIADQIAHFATIFAISLLTPNLYATGIWAPLGAAPLYFMIFIGGLVLATRAGAFGIAIFMAAHTDPLPDNGLEKGGFLIGVLERGMIYLLILFGQPGAIGLMIAAKSILRFGTVKEDRAASEYVIIGTLASFCWAILTAFAVSWLLSQLPPLAAAHPTP